MTGWFDNRSPILGGTRFYSGTRRDPSWARLVRKRARSLRVIGAGAVPAAAGRASRALYRRRDTVEQHQRSNAVVGCAALDRDSVVPLLSLARAVGTAGRRRVGAPVPRWRG